ncbi:MAG: T9SS type A sorting domain-containing protein [Bacteroidales bacterium]|jgi:hypothetical protein
MKRILFFTLMFLVSIPNFAQEKRFLNRHDKTHTARKVAIESQLPNYVVLEENQYVTDRDADIIIGETKYDVQSNSTLPHRINVFDDGTIGTVWTSGFTAASYPDRGTSYNYNDGSSWGEYPDARIETQRTGWANYSSYGANGEITCAHSGGSDGLIFSWRENKGTGDWNYSNLVGPAGHEDIIWPKMVVSGENNDIIHVIALTTTVALDGSIYEGLDGALLYSRSMDGGLTWNPENVILDGLTSNDLGYINADNYSWAFPRNGVIAFNVNNGICDGLIFKSTDQGDNWEKITFFQSPYPMQDGTMPFTAYWGADGTTDLLIDDEGKMHLAFGRTYYTWNDDIFYSFGADGLIYWNQDKPVLDSTIMGDPDALEAAGCLAAWVVEGPLPGDTLKNLTAYGGGMTNAPSMAFHRDASNNPIITIFYTSYDWNRVYTEGEKTYRSVWVVKTEDGGATWSPFENLTGDLFHMFNECVYHSLASEPYNDTYHLTYQSDGIPGRSASTSPDHATNVNSMVYLTYSPLPVDVNSIPALSVQVSQNYPNPVLGKTYVDISLNKKTKVSVNVFTLTGQKVMFIDYGFLHAGKNHVVIDANDLSSGVYFYTIKAGGSKITHKMIVK